MAWREIAESPLAHFLPPAGRRLLIVPGHGAEEKVLLIEEVFRKVVLIEHIKNLLPQRL